VARLHGNEEVVCVADVRNVLGEGPCWDAATRTLYWLDIKGRMLFWLREGQVGSQALPWMASVVAPLASGRGLILATERGLCTLAPGEGLQVIEPAPLPGGFRTNDGKVDPQGRLWWSSMDDDGGRRPGAIFRYSGANQQVVDGVHIANAVAFGGDGTFYLADSTKQTIWAFQTDSAGRLSDRRVFARIDHGYPDGAATDAEGCLWVAIWGGSRIDRFQPDGSLERSVPMPVSQPSSCIFGGAGLSTLYVTSACEGLSDQTLASEPLAGGLFAFRPGVAGAPVPPFAD
jgi:sugar lactone lactonase YvrE